MILTDNEKALGWEVSTAHSWLQQLPLGENKLVCRDCRVITKIGKFDVMPCREHAVNSTRLHIFEKKEKVAA